VMVGGIAVKVVTGSALAEGDADRARMQQILLNEGQRAADGNVRSFNNRALQRMAAENPTAYDALASRRGDLLPARAELEKARAAASGDDTPSAIRRGAVKGAELKGEEKEQIKKEAQQLGTLGKQTEGALDEAVRAEGKLDKAEEALERKQREIA